NCAIRAKRAAGSPAPLAFEIDRASGLTPDSAISVLSGIGPKRAEALAERHLVTLRDLVFHLPSRYQDWRERATLADLRAGTSAVVEGELGEIKERPMRRARWRRLASGWLSDATGTRVRLVWFNLPSYMRGRMPAGQRVLAHGRVTENSEGA